MARIREILSDEERLKRKAARARRRRRNKRLGITPAKKDKLTPEQIAASRRESSRAYYARNAEYYRAYAMRWASENREQSRAASARWSRENPERKKENKAKSNARPANIEKNKARCVARRTAYPEEYKARSSAWAKANPEKMRVARQDRHARESARGGKLSKGLSKKLMKLQRGKCACCRADLKKTKYDLDHMDPLALGGAHEDRNMQLLCPTCNRSKHAKHPIDFMQSRGFLL